MKIPSQHLLYELVHRLLENSFHPSMKSTAVQIDPESLSGIIEEKIDPSGSFSSAFGASVCNEKNLTLLTVC